MIDGTIFVLAPTALAFGGVALSLRRARLTAPEATAEPALEVVSVVAPAVATPEPALAHAREAA